MNSPSYAACRLLRRCIDRILPEDPWLCGWRGVETQPLYPFTHTLLLPPRALHTCCFLYQEHSPIIFFFPPALSSKTN